MFSNRFKLLARLSEFFVASILFLSSANWLIFYLDPVGLFPGYDYSFPLFTVGSLIFSIVFLGILLAYIFRQGDLINFLTEKTDIDPGKPVHDLMFSVMVFALWFLFSQYITQGIAILEIKFILGEEIQFPSLDPFSLVFQQILMIIPLVLIPIAWNKSVNNLSLYEGLGLGTKNLIKNLGYGVLTAIVTIAVIGLINTILIQFLGASSENILMDRIVKLGPAIAIFISIFAGFTEEIFFRGFIQTRTNIWIASILFAVTHSGYGIIIQIISPFLFGLIIGYLYEKTESIIGPIVAHSTMNMISLLGAIFLT
ncbi:MAG: Metal-dependent membrane protease, CAAX family [Candidatus Methanohalarchaeum thermophilum]|uniref:Metal-dependent membrane protease, CAAX family n=1 Tax=Methanohalarchaeum thermophilum TaxID=1903181 RepID=A0A1Q6DVZ3_METT1|nr:MAG: Metal-dependent membrane protease, CAAX family [Candidatus Methanohalarchaeum thermophilum]